MYFYAHYFLTYGNISLLRTILNFFFNSDILAQCCSLLVRMDYEYEIEYEYKF